MEYRFERTGTAALFILEGRIDASGSLELDRAIHEHLAPGDRAVLFDMGGVSYISSAAIRVFSVLEKALRGRGGYLVLCALRQPVIRVLEITGFARIFKACGTRDEGLLQCRLAERPAAIGGDLPCVQSAHTRLSAESFLDHTAVLTVTGAGQNPCCGGPSFDDLIPRIFTPGEYSAGTGIPGEFADGSSSTPGLLMTTGNAVFWRPAGSADPPDFLLPLPHTPRVLLHTAFSYAVSGQFHEILVAEPVRPEGVRLSDLMSDIFAHAGATRTIRPPLISVVMYAGTADPPVPPGTRTAENPEGLSGGAGERTLVSFGIALDPAADLSGYDPELLDALLSLAGPSAGKKGMVLYQHGLVFDSPPAFDTRDIPQLVTRTTGQEPCNDLVCLSHDTLLTRAVLGVSYLSGIVRHDSLPVRIRGECPGWNMTFETITRWMHPGCSDVELVPLTGGFSGTLVFRVNARDSRGASMMPLVMKLGPWPMIEQEIRGYTDHVKRYIQNNATQLIDTGQIGNYGGILYNFVGIRGAAGRIFPLEEYYLTHTTGEVLSVFEALFRIVLEGWYGEPRKKKMPLYRKYHRFWDYDRICAYARSAFSVTPGQEEITLPFGLGRSVNPLWFADTVMPGRASWEFPVLESSVHGDLNLRNVLMDETCNLWLIDFSETRYGHILQDIVKLEAVIKGEMVKPCSRRALSELVALDVPFLSARTLSGIPPLPHAIGNPALEKAFRCVHNLRMFADRITPGDDDISQYYLALLPYTLNLLSYQSVNPYEKEYGWIAASLLCRHLLEQEQPGK